MPRPPNPEQKPADRDTVRYVRAAVSVRYTSATTSGRDSAAAGCIDIRRIRTLVEDAGYAGCIEVEILNQAIWDQPGDEVLHRMKERYLSCV